MTKQPPGVRYLPPNWTEFTHDVETKCTNFPGSRIKRDTKECCYLALHTETTNGIQRWLHIPMEPTVLEEVLTGQKPVRTAMKETDFFYVSDQDPEGLFTQTSMTRLEEPLNGFVMEPEGLPEETAVMKTPAETVGEWRRQMEQPA